ncbi:hypothetical protein MPL1032_180219 [Mesorhizobium plurifarium]|uniref:Uncharacterized protein n=1 Tax=Mesorhizobium plurifarium TaxID=69974 RepID=A0A0K2VTZ6_MESPL|nr:hypothetical protein MPL1032_180219 [Mesorhizobium plurifarium]
MAFESLWRSTAAAAQDVGNGVRHLLRVTRMVDRSRKPVGQSQTPLDAGQKYDAAIRCDAPAFKRSCDLLAPDGWKSITAATYRRSWRV